MKGKDWLWPVLIAVGALLLFVPFLGWVHLFDWDEINFAECAREMTVTHDYSSVRIAYEPFWEKPPLFIWMQAACMTIFGVGELAARLPNALCGVATLLLIFHIGKRVYDRRFALLWVLAYAGSLLPHFYFKSGIIDPWFNFFIFAGYWFFIVFTNQNQPYKSTLPFRRELLWSGILLGLAVLTKGPAALLIFGLCFGVYWLGKRFAPFMTLKQFILFALVVIGTGSLWFIIEALRGRSNVITEFFVYQVRLFRTQDAGHGGPFYYHFVVLLVGCFPASVFALRAFWRGGQNTPWQIHVKRWMTRLLLVVLILFSIVQTKIVHYSSLCYFPLTYLAAYSAYHLLNKQMLWKRWMSWLLGGLATLLGAAFLFLPFIDHYKRSLQEAGLINDRFAAGNLEAHAHWNGFEWIVGVIFLGAVAYALWRQTKGDFKMALFGLFTGTLISTSLASVLLAPRVEEYSQAAAIRFFERLQNKDVYVETLGYKSYAQYFYSRRQPGLAENPRFLKWKNDHKDRYLDPKHTLSEITIDLQRDWMLSGDIDKPAYFICKNTFEADVAKYYPQLKKTGAENGFVFFVREPEPSH